MKKLKTYLWLSVSQLWKNSYYSCVSLFGIVFTVIIVSISFWLIDMLIGGNPPAVNQKRCLYIDNFRVRTEGKKDQQFNTSYYFLDKYVKSLKTPEKATIVLSGYFESIKDNNVQTFELRYTDENFWDIMKFSFIEGRPYTRNEIESGEKVAVITREVRELLLKGEKMAVGKYIESKGAKYKVIGVVENIVMNADNMFSNIWVPITTINNNMMSRNVDINQKLPAYDNKLKFEAIVLCSSPAKFKDAKHEFKNLTARIDPASYGIANGKIDAELLSAKEKLQADGQHGFINIVYIMIALFLLLPIFNFMSLNYNQFCERFSEIGIRRSFGATSFSIIQQLIFETLLLSILGGIIGYFLIYLLSDSIIDLVNTYKRGINFPKGQFQVDIGIIGYTLFTLIVFTLLSTISPALRISKLSIHVTLKQGEK